MKPSFLSKPDSFLPSLSLPADGSPHITGCVSANMETFRCRWDVGPFQSGQLRLFYINKRSGACVGLPWIGECDCCLSHPDLTLSSDTPTASPRGGVSVLTTAARGPTSASSVKTTPPSGPPTPSSCAPETSPSSTTRSYWPWPT